MKNYIEGQLKYGIHKGEVSSVLSHMFCTLGNGVGLDNKGYLKGNYRCKEAYVFPEEPQPLTYLYPWSDTEQYQPFRDLAGCRDVGFKAAANYFLACLAITPDSVEGARVWKTKSRIIREVLIDTPTIEDEYTDPDKDLSLFLEKISNAKPTAHHPVGRESDGKNSVTKKWFFDVQWSDCPQIVEDEVRELWCSRQLGNDDYLWRTNMNLELFDEYPNIYFWLKCKGVPEGEEVIVHWWW